MLEFFREKGQKDLLRPMMDFFRSPEPETTDDLPLTNTATIPQYNTLNVPLTLRFKDFKWSPKLLDHTSFHYKKVAKFIEMMVSFAFRKLKST